MLEWTPAREREKHKDARGLLSVAENSKQPEKNWCSIPSRARYLFFSNLMVACAAVGRHVDAIRSIASARTALRADHPARRNPSPESAKAYWRPCRTIPENSGWRWDSRSLDG